MKSVIRWLGVSWLVAVMAMSPGLAGRVSASIGSGVFVGVGATRPVALDLADLVEPGGIFWIRIPGMVESLEYNDQGLVPDEQAGDGVYSCSLSCAQRTQIQASTAAFILDPAAWIDPPGGFEYEGYSGHGQEPLHDVKGRVIQPLPPFIVAIAIMTFGFTAGCMLRMARCTAWWMEMSAAQQEAWGSYAYYMHICMNYVGCGYSG